jgi:arylsulfatase A-like enzyme
MRSTHGYVTTIITDKALGWLEHEWDRKRPFLLMLQHKAPHREWEPAPAYLTLFHDTLFPEPENLFDDYSGRGSAAKNQDMSIEKTMRIDSDLKIWLEKKGAAYQRTYGRMDSTQKAAWDAAYDPLIAAYKKADLKDRDLIRWKYQRYLQDYLATIRSVDENTGRVLDFLEKEGLSENTIVIYNSDQGFYLGEHGWFDKRFIYEESGKTPLLIRWPGHVPPGQKNDALTSNLDFAATFLDVAGIEIPSDIQGLSLLPLLRGERPSDWRHSLYYHYYEYPAVHMVQRHEGVITRAYKLIHFYDPGEWELYDLEKDPGEMNNVYSEPTYADVAATLLAELEHLRRTYQVPSLKPLTDFERKE